MAGPASVYLIVLAALAGVALWLHMRRRRSARARYRASDHAAVAGRHAHDGIVVTDLRGRILWANPAYCALMGWTLDEILGLHPLEFCVPEDERPDPAVIAGFQYTPGERNPDNIGVSDKDLHRNQRRDGTCFWNQISHSFHCDETGAYRAVLVCRDVTETIETKRALERNTAKLEKLAREDVLTGVANRASLAEFVEAALADQRPSGRHLGLLQIDLDNFKDINDLHGHAAGDAVLKHVTAATLTVLRDTDLLARIGGDEFVVACEGMRDSDALQKLGKAIRNAIAAPLELDGRKIPCDASIGGTLSIGRGETLQSMLRRADIALYDVKRAGRGDVAIYNRQMEQTRAQQSMWSKALREAIGGDGLVFLYQPMIDLASGDLVSFETLARWRQPDGTLLCPDKFLPMARDLGIEKLIDRRAARASAALYRHLAKSGLGDVFVSFNCSAASLEDGTFPAHLRRIARRSGVPFDRLCPEIAEQLLVESDSRTPRRTEALNQLVTMGFRPVLDDFRRGFVTLPDLPFAMLKCDRLVTRRIGQCAAGETIARALIDLGHALGHRMALKGEVPEGALDTILATGASLVQSDHLARPLSLEDAQSWLAARTAEIAPAYQRR